MALVYLGSRFPSTLLQSVGAAWLVRSRSHRFVLLWVHVGLYGSLLTRGLRRDLLHGHGLTGLVLEMNGGLFGG